jgi:hypothetical protein
MPSIRQSIRSSTASKRPTSAIADGQIALNTASGTPGIFFKDSAGNIVKAGPAHYGATAPNSSPAVGGSTGNSFGEAWLDVSLTPAGWKIWNGSAWVNATPLSSDTVQGLVELATNAETQAGVDAARAVTAASLQSKVSDSISTTSASGIASSTAVKTAYDLANAALPKSGGIVTGNLEIGSTGSFTFEGSTADGFETTLAVVDPTTDRTITFPNITGTVVTTGDTGTVTSTMILDGTILNADINASAAIVDTKLATIATAGKVSNSATTAASANTASAIVARDASGNFTAGTITAALTGAASANVLKAGDTMTGVLAVTAGTAALPGIAVSGDPNTGIYSPGADQVAISTNGTERMRIDSSGNVGVGVVPSAQYSTIKALQVGALGATVIFGNTSAGGTSGFGQNFYSDPSTADTKYAASSYPATSYHQYNGEHRWFRAPSGTAGNTITFTQAMTLDASGRLGIGTTTPGAPLEVVGSTNGDQLRINQGGQFYRIGREGSGGLLEFYGAQSGLNGYIFSGANGERMRIDSSGRVGIGNTTGLGGLLGVSGNISLSGAGTSSRYVGLMNETSTYAGSFILQAGGGSAGFGGAITMYGHSHASYPGSVYIGTSAGSGGSIIFGTNNAIDPASERMRIDSSGRLLVGTSSSDGVLSSAFQIAGTGFGGTQLIMRYATSDVTHASALFLARTRGSSASSRTIVSNGDDLGQVGFFGADGSTLVTAATIIATVDGTPGSGDMPGRLVFSTTADGAASPTERYRITNDGVLCYDQPAPATYAAAATLTVADLKTGIITYTGTAATLTLPTGTLTEGGFSGIYTNMTFEWSVINTGAGICTVGAGTAHTIVGSGTVAIGASARFTSRRTAANTFVSYRLS